MYHSSVFFYNEPVTTVIYTYLHSLSLPDACTISGRFRYGNGSLRYGFLRWMLCACAVVIQTAFLAFTLLLTLLGLNYSHEPLTGSNLASVLIVGMFAAMTWHFQFRPLNMMIQRKMIDRKSVV